jgi:hypothetical protein
MVTEEREEHLLFGFSVPIISIEPGSTQAAVSKSYKSIVAYTLG